MASSLATQLALGASLNASLLVDRSRRKPAQSYLFTSREADQHDVDSIHALGVNGFLRLKTVEPALGDFEDALFSDAAKVTDRTLQTTDANAELDRTIASFFPLLGPYLLEAPTGKVIEWLVRRFKIQEFNIEAVLSLFLPYHDAPHFAKMLSILHIKDTSKFACLLPYQTTSSPLTLNALVDLMVQPTHSDFARFVGSLLPSAVVSHSKNASAVHRGLIAFHTGVLLAFVKRSYQGHKKKRGSALDESTVAWVLPAAMEPLQACAEMEVSPAREGLVSEVILSSYLLLSAVSHTCPLSPKALSVMLKAITACSERVSPKQVIRTLASVCAGQEEPNEKMPKGVVKAVSKLPGVEEEIQEALAYLGTEKFVGPFVEALLTRLSDERALQIVTALITYPKLPPVMVESITASLIELLLGEQAPDENTLARGRSLLVYIQQRHPTALNKAFEASLNKSEKKEPIERFLLSFSMELPGYDKGKNLDMVVASTSADSTVRVLAIRELYDKLSSPSLEDAERPSVHSALLARVQDTNVPVLEELYSEPAQLVSILMADPASYIGTLSHILHTSTGPSPGRKLVKLHLAFVASHLYPILAQGDNKDMRDQVFYNIFFPFLLFSKPRQKIASLAWELIELSEKENSDAALGRHELLAGCADAVRWEEQRTSDTQTHDEDSYHATELLARVNLALAAKMAENIWVSSSFEEHSTTLLTKLHATDPYSKALAYLVCRSLLNHLSGERQVDAAHRVLQALGIDNFDEMDDFMRGADNLQVFLHDTSLSTAVVLKPTKQSTLHRLQVAILANFPTIPRPAATTLDWLVQNTVRESGPDFRGARYVDLLRTIYRMANSTTALPLLSSHLIRVLFISLGDDALTFLAGVWLNSNSDMPAQPWEFASLRHAAAFLEAHYASQRWVDFQTVLPSLLVALQHSDRRIREAALECVSALMRLCQSKKPSSIYAFDAIYGPSSTELQYLDWADLCKYVQVLYSSREHIVNDASYLRILHQQHIAAVKSDPKKEAGYKQRIVCYILSHVNGCTLPSVKLSLLRSIEEVASVAKVQVLLPIMDSLSKEEVSSLTSRYGGLLEPFASLVFAGLDETASAELNEEKGSSWSVYLELLRRFFQPSGLASPRAVLAHRLQSGLFSRLRLERKVEVCHLLLELGQQSPDTATDCRALLSSLLTEVPVILHILVSLQPSTSENVPRAKRAKLDDTINQSTDLYTSLGLLAEILSGQTLPASMDLVSCLLETLSKVVHDASSLSTEKTYVEQLLMSALENAATNIPAGAGLSSAAIRLDILVELIRVSENPQTFHQALLLMATLTRLAPDAVLHTVMPIFTFMGSNVFHRDDTYSFRVVQKTIDSIVPVMVASLKEKQTTPLDLYVASRTFLRIFTDATHHIPRHRRTHFFAHLIDVLGPEEFLPPVCLLLIDKVSNRVVRQSPEEASNALSLPLIAMQRSDTRLQLETLVEMLREAQRLISMELDPSKRVQTFLEPQTDEEHGSQSTIARRQARSILIFVGHALKKLSSSKTQSQTSGAEANTELLRILLDIAVSKADALSIASMGNIAKTAGEAVSDALAVMSASDFVNGAVIVLQSGDPTVQKGTLDLLGNQLVNITDKVREDLKPVIIKIIGVIKEMLSTSADPLLSAALRALNTLALTVSPGEEHSLTTTVPLVIDNIRERKSTRSALEVLLALSQKLGPRIIPFFKDIVKLSVEVCRTTAVEGESTFSAAVAVLQALLLSIPNFWSGGDIRQIATLYLDSCVSASKSQVAQLSSVIKVITKKVQSKVVLVTLCELWPSAASTEDLSAVPKLSGYFSILKKAIHAADRTVVSEQLRPLFKTFVDIFELCSSSPAVRDSLESDAIMAFLELVVKLNEAAFKPLFRKLFDWAFAVDSQPSRKLVFCHIYVALLDYFKGLMTPYMSFLLQPFAGLLSGFSQSTDADDLWLAVIQTLTKTLSQDEGAFWRDDKLRPLLSPMIAQIPVCTRSNMSETKSALSDCLIAMAEVISDDALLKAMNLDILMHTRSEDARLRLYALTCSEALWQAHGGKLIGFAPETATFIAECAEDDNDNIVREVHRLKNAVESIAGRIDV